MPKRKPFEELTFQDDFMFCKVMQNLRICRKVLRLVLKENIKIKNIKSQQTIENNSESKSIRLDVLVKDENDDIIWDSSKRDFKYKNIIDEIRKARKKYQMKKGCSN